MLKHLVVILNQDQLYFYFKANQKWQCKRIKTVNLSNLTEYLNDIPHLTQKTQIYFILDSNDCAQMTIKNPSLKLDHQTRVNLIHYHLSEKETSTHFHFDYKVNHKETQIVYVGSDFIQSLMIQFKNNNLKFIGFYFKIQITELNADFSPKVLLTEVQKNTATVFNLLPWRTSTLIAVKKQLCYVFCFFLLFTFVLPFLVRFFWLEQQKKAQQQLSNLTQLEQQRQAQLYEINTQLDFFKQQSETVAQVQRTLFTLTQPVINGIWLTAFSKNKKEWQLEGEALAAFLIHDLIMTYQQQLPEFILNFEIEKSPSSLSFKIKLREE